MTDLEALRALARLYGVQTVYTDITGRRRVASAEALLRVLSALGVPVAAMTDVPDALRAERRRIDDLVPPVVVVRGRNPTVALGPVHARTVEMELIGEHGASSQWTIRGGSRASRTVALPRPLPPGYHRLRVTAGAVQAESLVIAAPTHAYAGGPSERSWGVFLPLYALRTAGDWGAGDFSALGDLAAWIAALGGSVVATLPLLPVFLDRPTDPSPYAAISRRFWNEFYVDIERVPELSGVQEARTLIASEEFQRLLRRQRRQSLVSYREQMAQKRTVLGLLAAAFFRRAPATRREAFDRFVTAHPAAGDYAAFRAVMDRQRRSWRQWPRPLRDGTLHPTDYDEPVRQYHLYAQWIAAEQFAAVSTQVRDKGGMVYVDLPLGTHTWGYDAWRDRDVFADGVSTGAPPDTFFSRGQNWGAQPLHPQRLRRAGYRYYIECLRHHLAHATLLRIDHVMGLHRFFWIPDGFPATEGVYVRYPAEEFYTILALESVRHQAMIVGENLGTVPAYVTRAMRRHRILQTYVVQYALRADAAAPLASPPATAVAAVNTHDMPPFAAFVAGSDLRDLRRLRQLTPAQASTEWRKRQTMLRALAGFLRRRRFLQPPVSPRRMLRALLAYLGAGPAHVVLVSLEDLWGETQPQNTPGTADERPNWRRKAALTLEQMRRTRAVTGALRDLDRARRGGP